MLLFVTIVLVLVQVINGYHNHIWNSQRGINSISMTNTGTGVWPPINEISEVIDESSIALAKTEKEAKSITKIEPNESETILVTTLSGALASYFVSHEFTSVMIGTLLANSLAERRDAIGDTTRTFGMKLNELKKELDTIFGSSNKIIKKPHRFESNKAGLADPQFWQAAHSSVSYTLGNNIEAREQHLLMMKKIVEEEERIIMKQKIEKGVVEAENNSEVKVITYKKQEKTAFNWKPNFTSLSGVGNIGKFFKGSFSNARQQSIAAIDEWKAKEIASSPSMESLKLVETSKPLESFEPLFPQKVSSMSYKPKGRMQLAALGADSYSDYDNEGPTETLDATTNDIVPEVNIEPIITENKPENEDSSSYNFVLKSIEVENIHDQNVENTDNSLENNFILKSTDVENIHDQNIENTDSSPKIIDCDNKMAEIQEFDRFNQASDLERFRRWGVGIEWNKVKIQGSNLYYHIQKDKLFPEQSGLPISTSTTPKVTVLQNKSEEERSSWVREVMQKATQKVISQRLSQQ